LVVAAAYVGGAEVVLNDVKFLHFGAMDSMFDPGQPALDIQKVTVPIMCINTKNPMWTPEYQNCVRPLSPQTDYRTIDCAGHFMVLETPTEFNGNALSIPR